MLLDVTFWPSEIAEKHEECMDEPQTKKELSGQTMLPEQPIKEQTSRRRISSCRWWCCHFELLMLNTGSVVYKLLTHVFFFILAITQTDVSLPVKLYPPNTSVC
jgi:hypothetical protein